LILTNSTVSTNTGDDGGGIRSNYGNMILINTSVSENTANFRGGGISGGVTLINSLIANDCAGVSWSEGGNIESPGSTCIQLWQLQPTDQVNVTAEQLNLGPLADNGGPTETHALLPGSVAIDRIPEVDCVDADGEPLTKDQRGVARPQGNACDVGAFELEVVP
jgi:predicted outer membrane repeat protein